MQIIVPLIIGLIVGGIVLASLLSQLKSVVKQHSAADYVKKSSLQFSRKEDIFLYQKTERTAIQQQNNQQQNNSK
ncbi:MAG: hypothetical protein MJ065_03875 [Oscillospiraceae bacterium]|nr:hypothetical protein [Oscillospiraceae bacterium]